MVTIVLSQLDVLLSATTIAGGLLLFAVSFILALAAARQLDSASLLVNGNAVESAIEKCRSYPSLQLCLHLCLSEGRAVAPTQQVYELIDNSGRLKCSFGTLMLASCLIAYSV